MKKLVPFLTLASLFLWSNAYGELIPTLLSDIKGHAIASGEEFHGEKRSETLKEVLGALERKLRSPNEVTDGEEARNIHDVLRQFVIDGCHETQGRRFGPQSEQAALTYAALTRLIGQDKVYGTHLQGYPENEVLKYVSANSKYSVAGWKEIFGGLDDLGKAGRLSAHMAGGFIEVAKDKKTSEGVRTRIVQVLADATPDNPKIRDFLISSMKSGDESYMQDAARGLARYDDETTKNALLEVIKDTKDQNNSGVDFLRAEAVRSLVGGFTQSPGRPTAMNDQRVRAAIEAAAHDEGMKVSEIAKRVLAEHRARKNADTGTQHAGQESTPSLPPSEPAHY